MATVIDRALPYWFACRDYRTTFSSFVKVRAESDLWGLATSENPTIKAAAIKALTDLKLFEVHPVQSVQPEGAA